MAANNLKECYISCMKNAREKILNIRYEIIFLLFPNLNIEHGFDGTICIRIIDSISLTYNYSDLHGICLWRQVNNIHHIPVPRPLLHKLSWPVLFADLINPFVNTLSSSFLSWRWNTGLQTLILDLTWGLLDIVAVTQVRRYLMPH